MISIVMPLCNGANFLRSSVKSIIGQTYQDWELLIGVNGLADKKAKKILKEIGWMKDSRISVHIFSEKGKVKALNKLVQMAQYDNICLIDVDDYWLEQKLEKQLPLIQKYDVIGSDAQYFGDRTDSPMVFLGQLTPPMFTYQNPLINSSIMIKKDNAQWEEAWEGLDDYNLWVSLLDKQKTFYNVPEVLVKHRIHKQSAFNHTNGDLSAKLKKEKLPILSNQENLELARIMENKDWKL